MIEMIIIGSLTCAGLSAAFGMVEFFRHRKLLKEYRALENMYFKQFNQEHSTLREDLESLDQIAKLKKDYETLHRSFKLLQDQRDTLQSQLNRHIRMETYSKEPKWLSR